MGTTTTTTKAAHGGPISTDFKTAFTTDSVRGTTRDEKMILETSTSGLCKTQLTVTGAGWARSKLSNTAIGTAIVRVSEKDFVLVTGAGQTATTMTITDGDVDSVQVSVRSGASWVLYLYCVVSTLDEAMKIFVAEITRDDA